MSNGWPTNKELMATFPEITSPQLNTQISYIEFCAQEYANARAENNIRAREMWLEDLGYDDRVKRLCFHGGCIGTLACITMRLCMGGQPFVRQQQALWDGHAQSSSAAPYAFWLGADA